MKRSRASNKGFSRGVQKQHRMNNYTPMRGGIRL